MVNTIIEYKIEDYSLQEKLAKEGLKLLAVLRAEKVVNQEVYQVREKKEVFTRTTQHLV